MWKIVINDLPKLKKEINGLLSKEAANVTPAP